MHLCKEYVRSATTNFRQQAQIFTNGPFKIFVSASLLALDSNREARTSNVFKIEHELVIFVEARAFIKNKYRTFKNYLTKNSLIALVSNKINYPRETYI